jgi:hypothetical protein
MRAPLFDGEMAALPAIFGRRDDAAWVVERIATGETASPYRAHTVAVAVASAPVRHAL